MSKSKHKANADLNSEIIPVTHSHLTIKTLLRAIFWITC